MGRYLDEFISVIPAIQGKQILEILNTARDVGEVRTLDEFQARLQELTETLQGTDPQPTFELIKAVIGKPIRGDAFNLQITSAINDLETAFKEIQNVAEVLQIHKTLINENILNNLKFAINDLETKIAIQEFLNSDVSGFTKAQFNTFKQSQTLSTKRSDLVASDTYVDNQTGLPIASAFDGTVDIVGEKLIMAPKRTKFITSRNARSVFDAQTRLTELNVEFPGSNVRNIIDNQTGTYWIYPVLLGAPDKEGIIAKVELELPGYQDINFLEFEPATLAAFTLEKVIYTDVNSEDQTLEIDELFINKNVRVDFSVVTTKKLVFHFRQKSYKHIQYSFNQNSRLWERAISNTDMTLDDIDKTILNDDLLETLNAEQLRDLNDIAEPVPFQDVNMYEYLVGFDNIRVGFTQYENTSIFVSSVLEGSKIGILGLRARENRLESITSNFPITSFEYSIFKQNFASDGSLVDSEKFQIIPAAQQSISHERLIFNETTLLNKDTATLRFYPTGTILVYKDFNLTPLVEALDYIVIDNGSLTPKEYKIQLVNPSPTSIYTISYIQAISGTSTGSEIWLNKQRTMKLTRGNIIEFTNERPNATVATSKVFLTVLFRNNSTIDTETPSLEEYRLLIGTINLDKFTA